MIADITGVVTEVSKDHLVISLGGMGYEVRVAESIISTFTKGQEVHLYTRLSVREDNWTLYGFSAKEQRTLFDLLRSVSGVGPKTALALISLMSLRDFYDAVLRKDEKALIKVPGIGRKTAGRIILELRDKIGLKAEKDLPLDSHTPHQKAQEACEALEALGYSWEEANFAVQEVTKNAAALDLETILKEALRNLARA